MTKYQVGQIVERTNWDNAWVPAGAIGTIITVKNNTVEVMWIGEYVGGGGPAGKVTYTGAEHRRAFIVINNGTSTVPVVIDPLDPSRPSYLDIE